MGEDDALAARLGEQHRQSFARLRHQLGDLDLDRSVTIVAELDPLPLAIVETDARGFEGLVASADVQVIYDDIVFRPLLHQTLPIIQASSAHSAGASGSGHAVAVLDTGVQRTHPMFSGKIVGEACYATSNPGYAGCPSGHTWGSTASGAGETCSGSTDCNHGTHVAGIAVGSQQTTPLGPTVKGVAYAGNLVPVRVAALSNAIADCGSAAPCAVYRLTDTLAALSYVYSQRNSFNIASVNLSYGIPTYFSGHCAANFADIAQQVNFLNGAAVAVVAASGNFGEDATCAGTLAAPACIENAVSVAAVDKNSNPTAYSNISPTLDLFAPGGNSSAAGRCSGSHQCVLAAWTGSSFNYSYGTSMAAPHVAGAFAALRNLWPKTEASVTSIVGHLKATGLSINYGIDSKPLLKLGQALSKPTKPALVNVERGLCYGSNTVS